MSKITESARGEDCQVRIIGVCTHDPEKTIWSHARWYAAGRGRSIKAPDVCGAYCCTACDQVYDGQMAVAGLKRSEVDMDWCMGHFRSLIILGQKGLI